VPLWVRMKKVKPLDFPCGAFLSGEGRRLHVLLGLRSELSESGGEKRGNADMGVRGVKGLMGDFIVRGLPGSSFEYVDLTSYPGLLLSLIEPGE
jgi:hypothetical protein